MPCPAKPGTVGSNPTRSAILRPVGYGWQAILPLATNMMWYVYVLRSVRDGRLYVGSTDNLKRRLTEHESGRSASTRIRRPLSLEAYVAVKEEATVRELEAYLKTGSGMATLRRRILPSGVRRT